MDVPYGAEVPGSEPRGSTDPIINRQDSEFDDLLRRENLETLPEENKLAVKALLKMQRAMAVKDVREEKEVRLITAGMRKPPVFSPKTMTLRQFVCGYEAYTEAMGLSESAIIGGFITYLDPPSQERLSNVDNLDRSSWKAYKIGVLKILEDSSKYNELSARFHIRNIKQLVGESVHQFGERLRDLGNIGFPQHDSQSREAALKDALAAGIRNDEIGIQLIRVIATRTFDELLEDAITLAISHEARSKIRVKEDAVEVSVLRAGWDNNQDMRNGAANIPQGEYNPPPRSGYNNQQRRRRALLF